MQASVVLGEDALQRHALELGRRLRGSSMVLLSGPMGAGKTTFVRALAKGLRVTRPNEVRSPTYTLCVVHEGPIPLVHIDLHRLDDEGSVAAFESIGLETAIEEDEGSLGVDPSASVYAIEWAELWWGPDRVPPRPWVRVTLGYESDATRTMSVEVDTRLRPSLERWCASL